MSDWSHLDYKKHLSKKDLTSKNKKDNCKQIGYDLQTTIAVSDITGEPIAPMVHNLKTDKKVYSTYSDDIKYEEIYLNEYKNIKELNKSIKKYMDLYNKKRLHSAIDYKTPDEVYYQAVNNLNSKGEKLLQKVS